MSSKSFLKLRGGHKKMSWIPSAVGGSSAPKVSSDVLATLPSPSTDKSGPMFIDATTPPRPLSSLDQEALSRASDLELTYELFGSMDSNTTESDDFFSPECSPSEGELYPENLPFTPWYSREELVRMAAAKEKEEEPKTLFEMSPVEYDTDYKNHEQDCHFCRSYFCGPCSTCGSPECQCECLAHMTDEGECLTCGSIPCVCLSDHEPEEMDPPSYTDSDVEVESEPEVDVGSPYPTPPATPRFCPLDDGIRRGGEPQGHFRHKKQATSRCLRKFNDSKVREFGKWIDLTNPRDVEAYLTFVRDWMRNLRLPETKKALIDFVESWACHSHRRVAVQILAMNRCGPRPKLFVRILRGDRSFDYEHWKKYEDHEPQSLDDVLILVQIFMYTMIALAVPFLYYKSTQVKASIEDTIDRAQHQLQERVSQTVLQVRSNVGFDDDAPIIRAVTTAAEAFNQFSKWVEWAKRKIVSLLNNIPPEVYAFVEGFAGGVAVLAGLVLVTSLTARFVDAVMDMVAASFNWNVRTIRWLFEVRAKNVAAARDEIDLERDKLKLEQLRQETEQIRQGGDPHSGGNPQYEPYRPKSALHSCLDFLAENLIGTPHVNFWSVAGVLPKVHSVGRAIEWLFENIKKLIHWAVECWTGQVSPREQLEHEILDFHKMALEFEGRMRGPASGKFGNDMAVLSEKLLIARQTINQRIVKTKEYRPYFGSMFLQSQALFQRMHIEYETVLRQAPPRQPPVWVYLWGPPGCGKSSTLLPLASKVWSYVQAYQDPTKPIIPPGQKFDLNQVYGWIEEDSFKDGFRNQFCVSIDEFGQSKVPQTRNACALQMMRMCSTTVCPVLMADPDKKNTTYFGSPLIITTTNLAESFKGLDWGIVSEDAFEERRSFVAKIDWPSASTGDTTDFTAGLYQKSSSASVTMRGYGTSTYYCDEYVDFDEFAQLVGEMIIQNQRYAVLPPVEDPLPRCTRSYKHARSSVVAPGGGPQGVTDKEKEKEPEVHSRPASGPQYMPDADTLASQKYLCDVFLFSRYRRLLRGAIPPPMETPEAYAQWIRHALKVAEFHFPADREVVQKIPVDEFAQLLGPPAFGFTFTHFSEETLSLLRQRPTEDLDIASLDIYENYYDYQMILKMPHWLRFKLFQTVPIHSLPLFVFDSGLSAHHFKRACIATLLDGKPITPQWMEVIAWLEEYRRENYPVLHLLRAEAEKRYALHGKILAAGGLLAVAAALLAVGTGMILTHYAYKKRKPNPQMAYPGNRGEPKSSRALTRQARHSEATKFAAPRPSPNPSNAFPQSHSERYGLLARAADWVETRIVKEGTSWEDASSQKRDGGCFCLWIRDTTVMIPTHVYKSFGFPGYDAFLSFLRTSDITVRLKDCVVQELDGDISLVTLPKTTINARRDITGLFCQDLPDKPDIVHLVPSLTDTSYHTAMAKSYVGEVCYSECHEHYKFYTDLVLEGIPNAPGQCGTVYCDHKTGEVLAVHMAGTPSTDTAYASLITRKEVAVKHRPPTKEDVLNIIQQGGTPHCAFHDQFPYTGNNPMFYPGVRPENTVSSKYAGYISKETKLRLSAFKFTTFPVPETTFSPVALSPGKDEDGVLQRPLQNALAKYGRQACVPMNLPPVDFSSWFPRIMRVHKVGPCSMYQAVFGIPGYMKSIDFSTSPGLYFKKKGYRTRRELCFNSKGEPCLHQDLIDRVVFILQLLAVGIVPQNVYEDQLKDELRKATRHWIPRLFNSGGLAELIVTIMFLGPLFIELESDPTRAPCGLGLDAHSHQWGRLYSRLRGDDRIPIAGDFSDFDSSLKAFVKVYFCQMIAQVYPSEYLYTCILVVEMNMNGIHICVTTVYTTWFGTNSGSFLTSVFNSFANWLLHVLAWMNLYPQEPFNLPCTFTGDDSLLSVDQDHTDYNMEYLADFFWKQFRMRYTAPDKTLKRFLSWEEVTYLKRRFVPGHAGVMAPLELDSIANMVKWTDSPGNQEVEDSVVRSLQLEAWHHGADFYNAVYDWLKEESRRKGRVLPVLSFAAMTESRRHAY